MGSFFWFELLRYWIYLTVISSVVESWLCYQVVAGQARIKNIYPRADWQQITTLAARQLGLNHALLVLIRVYGGLMLEDEHAFNLCRWSYVIVFLHFLWERIGTRTVDSKSLSMTEGVAFISIFWMYAVTSPMRESHPVYPDMLGHSHPYGF